MHGASVLLFALALVLAMAAAWWLVGKLAFLLPDPMYLDRELDFLPVPPKLRVARTGPAYIGKSQRGQCESLQPLAAPT